MNFVCRICGNNIYSKINEDSDIFYCTNCTTLFIDPNEFSLSNVYFKRLDVESKMPEKAHDTDSGFDLFSLTEHTIDPGTVKLVKTGIAIELPHGFEAQVRCRSGMGKKGIMLANGIGTVDNGYRNDVGILLYNSTITPYSINKHDKIAQLVISQVLPFNLIEREELSDTSRGLGGFGSTGR